MLYGIDVIIIGRLPFLCLPLQQLYDGRSRQLLSMTC